MTEEPVLDLEESVIPTKTTTIEDPTVGFLAYQTAHKKQEFYEDGIDLISDFDILESTKDEHRDYLIFIGTFEQKIETVRVQLFESSGRMVSSDTSKLAELDDGSMGWNATFDKTDLKRPGNYIAYAFGFTNATTPDKVLYMRNAIPSKQSATFHLASSKKVTNVLIHFNQLSPQYSANVQTIPI